MTSRAPLSRLSEILMVGIASLALASSTALASPARAADGSDDHGHHHGRSNGAPEIDPRLAAAGIVLLIGGTLVLTGRRRPATN